MQPPDQRDHGLAPEGAIGLLKIGVGVIARQAEQQRRHAKGQRNFARGGIAGLRKIHILRRERQRLPVEPAFEQQRTPGVERAGEILLQLLLEPRELLVGKMRALGPGVDQRAGGSRRIIEQRLVPVTRGVMLGRRRSPSRNWEGV